MRSRYLKILGVISVLSLLTAFSVFAGPNIVMNRDVSPSNDIQFYFAVHGVDQTLKNMVWTELKNDIDIFGYPSTISMTLGTTTFTLPNDASVPPEDSMKIATAAVQSSQSR